MPAGVVVKAEYALPQSDGDGVVVNYTLAISPSTGAEVIIESADVTVLPGDSPNTINSKIGAVVRARAAAYGITLPANSVVAPAYSKA